jgi:NTE family protein
MDTHDCISERLISLLRRSAPLFVREPENIEAIANAMRWFSLPGGNILFKQNAPSDAIYFVLSGMLGVYIENASGAERIVSRLGPGEIVGEMGCITGEPRGASVRALRSSELLAISWKDIETIATKDPGILLFICRTVVQRLNQTQQGRAASFQPRTFALVSISEDVDVRAFAENLKTALNAIVGTILATRDECQQMIADELFELEKTHKYVLYVAENDSSGWSRLCLRQADTILIVAHGNVVPQRIPDFKGVVGRAIPVVLMLTWDINTQPANTAEWIKLTGASRHFHIRRQSDLERAARLLTGKGFGLVLSGGGARGFAHIGVARALRENAISIDVIMGTSIGALIGAGIALEFKYEMLLEEARRFSNASPLFDITIPRLSLLAGRNIRAALRRWFADLQIEDTRAVPDHMEA